MEKLNCNMNKFIVTLCTACQRGNEVEEVETGLEAVLCRICQRVLLCLFYRTELSSDIRVFSVFIKNTFFFK